jgi:hypothetical protein
MSALHGFPENLDASNSTSGDFLLGKFFVANID